MLIIIEIVITNIALHNLDSLLFDVTKVIQYENYKVLSENQV